MRTPSPNKPHRLAWTLPLALAAGCGVAPVNGEAVPGVATAAIQVQNGEMQNGEMQNGEMQNGPGIAIVGVDLRTMQRLKVLPAAGQHPDLSPSNLEAMDFVYLDKTLLQQPLVVSNWPVATSRTVAARLPLPIRSVPVTSFKGTVVDATFTDGTKGKIYIADVQLTDDPEIVHYTLEAYHEKWYTAIWPPNNCNLTRAGCPMVWDWACGANRIGRLSVPVAATAVGGQWNYDKGYAGAGGKVIRQDNALYNKLVTFACVDGAIAKCVEKAHYKPWALANEECFGSDPADCYQPTQEMAHEACVRMVRADYCGDGQDHTLNGISIDIWDQTMNSETPYSTDPTDWNASPPTGLPYGLEAEWTPNGARCVSDILMPRTSHQGAGMTVQQYLEGQPQCKDKWGTNYPWSNGVCFGRFETTDQSTYFTANVPWNYVTHQPAMDMRNRVWIRNSSVCIDDSDFGRPNPLKTSSEWSGRCL